MAAMTAPRLFVAGAAHPDRRGRMSEGHAEAASSPGAMREDIGGGAFNALRNAARHGVATAFLSVRGLDGAGKAVERAIRTAKASDHSAIRVFRRTASYTALLDAKGDLIAGLADMEVYDGGFERQVRARRVREAVAACDAVLCDANMSAAALLRLCAVAGCVPVPLPVYAIAVSPAKAPRLRQVLPVLSCAFMTLGEARALTGDEDADGVQAVAGLRGMGLRGGVVTNGAAALAGFIGERRFTLTPPQARRPEDVTGAGDALAGVTVAHMLHGMELEKAVRRGVAAATLTIATQATVARYTQAEFMAALALVPEPAAVP